jgi:hypothetical protein
LRGKVIAGLWQPSTGHFERWVFPQIVEVVGVGIAASDGKHAGPQDIGHRVGDLARIAMVGNDCGERIDQAKPFVGTGQQQDTAVGTDPSTIEPCGDFLLADTWQRERQKRIVWVDGHGRFRPGMGRGVDTQTLCDSSSLYHAHRRIPAMQ